jgi:hypothetical protein
MKKFLLFILLFQIVQFVANAQIQSGQWWAILK